MSLQINNTGFQAAAAPVSYNNRYTPPMSEENVMNDIFLMQQAEQQKASKREKAVTDGEKPILLLNLVLQQDLSAQQ